MTELNQAALVLEGGGSRGVFTAGVLDYLMEQEERFSYVTGVSAGACNALDYVSWQPGRTKNCMIVTEKENRYVGTREALKHGHLFDMDMVFDKYPNSIFPFDSDQYFASEMKCEMVVTNCRTGKAEYLSEDKDRERLLLIGRASSSLPIVSAPVLVDDNYYMDGGVADSIPLIHAMNLGYRKNVVILTREFGYRKEKPGKSRALYIAAMKKYPELLNQMLNRYHNYNRTVELIEKWEKEGHIFVIRPEEAIVSRTEQDVEKLTAFYQQGYDLMKKRFDEMQVYLKG